jgi:maleate isomerase
MTGSRARLGVIYPSSGLRDADFHRLVPAGVSAHVTRVAFRHEGTVEAIREMSSTERLVEAARLVAATEPSCITWADTSGSFLFGPDGDAEQIRAIEQATGVRASTTSTACLAAFRRLGARRIAVASPYLREVNVPLEEFLKAHDLEVLRLESLELRASREIARVPAPTLAALARRARHPEAQALFIPCTDFLDIDLVPDLERELSLPVVGANPATVWHALRIGGIRDAVAGFGTLMTLDLGESAGA